MLILSFFSSTSVLAQNAAGPDKMICTGGSVQLGIPQSACNGCCWKWEPSAGLNNATVPNPTVSGLTTTTEYTLIQSNPDGSASTDKVVVYLCKLNLDVHKPKFIDVTEPKVPEEDEETKGVQTFVNLDSDDNDSDFDNNDPEVSGGDDEFCKLEITMELVGASAFPPPPIPIVKIKSSGIDISAIRLWKSNDKSAGEYFLDEPFELLHTTGNIYSGFLWVEGILGHTTQQATKLYAAFDSGTGANGCHSGNVSITVIGIQSISWQGMQNGYTGDGKNNSDNLDMHPSENGYPDHVRVFPEAKFNGTGPTLLAKDKVGLKITLSVKPIDSLPIYIRLFDADDPSGELAIIDPNDALSSISGDYEGHAGLQYDENNDNRGLADIYKFGKLMSLTSLTSIITNLGTYEYINNANEFILTMQVSSYPGDNYEVAVYGDLDFVKKLRNLDKYDKRNVIFESIDCVSTCPPIEKKIVSEVLTVWRTLHIEYDLMANPTWDKNLLIKGYFTDYEAASGSNSIKQVKKLNAIQAHNPGSYSWWNDNEPLKDGSPAPGRFSDGGVRIGNPISATVCDKGGCIDSNGPNEITFATSTRDLTSGGGLVAILTSTTSANSPPLTITNIEKK